MATHDHLEESSDLERAMEEARNGTPASEELQTMLSALGRKREALRSELETLAAADPLRPRLERELRNTEQQIRVLEEETLITRFVENSVRVAYRVSRLRDGDAS